MTKKSLKFYILIIILFFLGLTYTNAATASATVNRDLVKITYSQTVSDNRLSFYYGTDSSQNKSTNVLNTGMAIKTTNTAQISLKNGKYYFWVFNSIGGSYTPAYPRPVVVDQSCTNEKREGVTGTFTIQRCFILSDTKVEGDTQNLTSDGKFLTCASGYKIQNTKITTDTCNKSSTPLGAFNKRYCKRVYTGSCVKDGSSSENPPSVPAPSLTSLSVSSGKLSPTFKSGTKNYTVSVASNVTSVKINATAASGSSFVKNYGPRTVSLDIGSNTYSIKVKNSAGKTVTYKITIKRADNRSNVNTLSNLTVSAGTLNPAFSSTITNYTVNVARDVESLTIGATLTDSTSSFVSGFGPRTVTLTEGTNKAYIKVKSQKGETNVYNLTIIRESTPSKCTTETAGLALLKNIELTSDALNVQIDQIPNFDKNVFTYSDIKVDNLVTDLKINAYVETEGDTVTIEGNEELEVNVSREIKITVTSKECPNYSNVYTLNVTRQEKVELSQNAELGDLKVSGKKPYDITFEPNIRNYDIILKKGDTTLTVEATGAEPSTECDVNGNEDLKKGSEISIVCVAEDKKTTENYTITIKGVEKGTNLFLIIIVIIIIIILLIYLILRLLGYKIYFNFGVIGAFFRGIGEKINGIFDK